MKAMEFAGIVRLHKCHACSRCKQRMNAEEMAMFIKYEDDTVQLLCTDCNNKRVHELKKEIEAYADKHGDNMDMEVFDAMIKQINPFMEVDFDMIEVIEDNEDESCDCPICQMQRGGNA